MAAAVSIPGGLMDAVTEKLTFLLGQEMKLLGGPREEIEFLRRELIRMKAALERSAMSEGQTVKVWMKEVQELAYDIEDCIDEFMYQVAGDEGDRGFFLMTRRPLKKLSARRRLENQIHELKNRFIEATDRRVRYGLDIATDHARLPPPYDATSRSRSAATVPWLPDRVVGMDGPRDELISWLEIGSTQRLKVLSIVGLGGVGKTTLAKAVFDKIVEQFDCRAFVSVSQNLNTERLFRHILSQVEPGGDAHRSETLEYGGLIHELRECLRDRRYLIVIDDIWSTSAWDTIKSALPENNHGSRIITTTRIMTVAQSCCSRCEGRVYEIKSLSYDDSRSLFFERIFGPKYRCPEELKEVSDKILKICGGLPLAIISMAGLLASKPVTLEQWKNVVNSSYHITSSNMESVGDVLSISYNDLPHHLKICFVYLSIFPGDYEIKRDRLVRRWIAEGFVTAEQELSLEEVGERYFDELINRSMMLPVDIESDGRAKSCRVHGVMFDFITSVAAEENFVTLLGDQGLTRLPHDKVRRLSLYHINAEGANILKSMILSRARSLTVFGHTEYMPPLKEFRVLRVLDLEGCKDLRNYDLKNIGKLSRLKYLSIKDTQISEIPQQIGKLLSLETLDLRGTQVRHLPAGVVQLRQLVHLLAEVVSLPRGARSMQTLRQLSGIDVCKSSIRAVQELGHLTNLRELQVWWNPYEQPGDIRRWEENFVYSLSKLSRCNLRSLSIDGLSDSLLEFLGDWSTPPSLLQRFKMNNRGCCLPNIPEWMSSLSYLVDLEINVKEVIEEYLCMLGNLPSLLHLVLRSKASPRERPLIIPSEGFQTLKRFYFYCDTGAYLSFQPGAMPILERLHMPFHVQTAVSHGFYFGIEQLKYLREINVTINSEGADTSDVTVAEAAIRDAADIHPNHPIITVLGFAKEEEDKKKEEEEEENRVQGEHRQQLKAEPSTFHHMSPGHGKEPEILTSSIPPENTNAPRRPGYCFCHHPHVTLVHIRFH